MQCISHKISFTLVNVFGDGPYVPSTQAHKVEVWLIFSFVRAANPYINVHPSLLIFYYTIADPFLSEPLCKVTIVRVSYMIYEHLIVKPSAILWALFGFSSSQQY